MGSMTLETVLNKLREAGFQADMAYHGGKCPVITGPVAAVHLEKVDRTDMTATVEVSILAPATLGGSGCEAEALRAMEALHRAGGACVQNGCVYNSLTRVYAVNILADFPWSEDEEDQEKLQFKTFTWPSNPAEYREEFLREPLYTKTETGGSTFSGMGPMKRVITGSGAFTGTNAAASFNSLAVLFGEASAGTLTHPLFGSRMVYFTGLELHQSPRKDYAAYSFQFTEADSKGTIPK